MTVSEFEFDQDGLIALWDFVSGGNGSDDGVGGAASQPAGASGADPELGSFVAEFRVTEGQGAGDTTVLGWGTPGGGDLAFEVRLRSDGAVEVLHRDGGSDAMFRASTGFAEVGDSLKLTYSWSATDGQTLIVENQTAGTIAAASGQVSGLKLDLTGGDGRGLIVPDGSGSGLYSGRMEYAAAFEAGPAGGLNGIVEGSSGSDRIDIFYSGDPEGDRIDAGDAILPGHGPDDDVVLAMGGDDTVFAGNGDDTVDGGSGDDVLYGDSQVGYGCKPGPAESGDDVLYGGEGRDKLFGEAGNDTLFGGNDKDSLWGGDGDDSIFGGNGNDFADGGSGDDTIDGGNGRDLLFGGKGDDSLTGGNGDDILKGGADQDTLEGGDGDDCLYGGSGDDLLDGGRGNDLLSGGSGADLLTGGKGDDRSYGGSGNDTLNSDQGADYLSGGDDADVFNIDSAESGRGDVISGGAGGVDFDQIRIVGNEGVDFRLTNLRTDSDGNGYDGTIEYLNASGGVTGRTDFTNIEDISVVCFTPESRIATPKGERLMASLRPGDRVITRDNGIQEIRWVGRRDLTSAELDRNGHIHPVLIRQGALGNGLPERDMLVSPNHRMLVANDKTALYFEEREVLVAAKHLTGLPGVKIARPRWVSYIHFLFDRHEIVLADGTWTESFQPGDQSLGGVGNAQRIEIFELFPELKTQTGLKAYGAARRSLKGYEARLLH